MQNPFVQRMPLEDLLAFHQLSRALASSLDRDTILRTILEQMEKVVGASQWALLLRDEAACDLYYAIAAGGDQHSFAQLRVRMGEGVAGWVAKQGETLIVPEDADDARLLHFVAPSSTTVRSVMALPLRGRRGTCGVIEIYNLRTDHLTDSVIALLHILADHAAIAIENSEDVARIQQLTITDDATGLYNARHLYEVLESQLDTMRHQGSPVSLAFIDLDRFKLVNDHYGHLIGSELLAKVGQRLAQLSRPQDLCFRYGGDEFVVLMPGADRHQAAELARNQLRRLMNSQFAMSNGVELSIRASVGVSTAPNDGEQLHAILGTADARMYRVKNDGRGHVLAD